MRALGLVAAAYLGGIAIAALCAPTPVVRALLAIVALGLGLGTAAAAANRPLAALLLALVGALTAGVAARDGPARVEVPAGVVRLAGTVESVRTAPPSFVLRVTSGERLEDHVAVPPGTRVRLAGAAPWVWAHAGVLARVAPWAPFRNPTPHPALFGAIDADARGHVLRGTRPDLRDTPWAAAALGTARDRVRSALHATLDARTAGIADALVLGDADGVDDASDAAVRGAGLAHVLAVSGMHVVILVGLLVALLRRTLLLVPRLARRIDVRRVACAVGVPLAPLYAAFAGGAPSAWRSALAASLGWALVAAGRRPRAGPVAAAAALVFAAASPEDALRPAFLLSVVATAALVTHRSDAPGLRALLVESTRTALATAPLVLWCFQGVPLLGVAANVLLAPFGSLVLLPLASVHAVVATLARPLAPLTAVPLELATDAFVGGAATFARAGVGLGLPPATVPQGVVIGALCLVLLAARTWRTRAVALAVAALALCAAEAHVRHAEQPHGVLRATFLDVGQGDAALLDLPDGRVVLVDAGGGLHGAPDPGRAVIVPLLRARRRDAIDVVVLTHPHPDHYGGLRAVLAAVPVRELWDTGQGEAEDADGAASAVLADARRRGTRIRRPDALCGTPQRFGAARIDVLSPCPRYDPGWEPNDDSFVLRVSLGRRALLLTGDVEARAETVLAATRGAQLRADVLKVAHHGSRTSSTDAFLYAVRPRFAIVSAGVGNGFGHPHDAALARLRAAGARVVRIDAHGGTTVTTDGDTLTVRAWDGTSP